MKDQRQTGSEAALVSQARLGDRARCAYKNEGHYYSGYP